MYRTIRRKKSPPRGTLADAGASPTAASFQAAVLLHLARAAPALPVQRVISTVDGRPELHLDGRVVRMTSYLQGPVLGSRPASAALRRDIGGTLGQARPGAAPVPGPVRGAGAAAPRGPGDAPPVIHTDFHGGNCWRPRTG
ncbi:MAG TPA: hypothetical protein VFE59_38565 [Trebonia sp.]|nr:hypothetical protein [Trebonia sp.]